MIGLFILGTGAMVLGLLCLLALMDTYNDKVTVQRLRLGAAVGVFGGLALMLYAAKEAGLW